ncbi:MAG: DUF2612 domain-containing protein [Elusimicrobiales bacterium]|nr:DUF2612 domain-containing protein [Elusimicrobiales bacterium]
MKTLTFEPKIDLKQCLLWQYNNAPSLRALLLQKEAWYKIHQTDFWNYWYNNVFNLDTADDFGLGVWGEILDFPRQVKSVDGSLHVLTAEQYRTVLKGQMLKFNMGVTAPEVNRWLQVVFGSQGKAYCLDNLDMTAIPFVFEQSPSEEIIWLLANVDFLPRPAGVGYEVRLVGQDIFGFNGSGLQTFNNGVFYKDYNSDLEQGDFQLTVNAPTGALVLINNVPRSYVTLPKNAPFTVSVTGVNMLPFAWEAALSEDLTLTINQLTVNAPEEAEVQINGQTARGAYFRGSFTYSLTAVKQNVIPISAQGTAVSDTNIQISQLTISPVPEDAVVVVNRQAASGALFISALEYSYNVSREGYRTVSGSGTTVQSLFIPVYLSSISWTQSRSNITQDIGQGIIPVGEYTLPATGKYSITLAGQGQGANEERWKVSRGGITSINAELSRGDTVSFSAVSSGRGFAGVGIAMYVNDVLVAVSGGGGYVDDNNTCYGGDGYIGGDCSDGPAGTGILAGTNNNTPQGADGSYNFYRSATGRLKKAYGGSGYAVTGNTRFTISQTYGVQNGQGNSTGAYFSITFLGE